MKWFFISFAVMLGAAALFVFGALGQNAFLMLFMCPGAIVALWVNGFAAARGSKSFAKVIAKVSGLQVVDIEQQKQRPSGTKAQPKQEYE